ncbi:hypothetical protein D051_3576 [Vibrio parahaemolyticus VPCR-2010]|nr:hypothetical protein D051_3576 [Vibrio parahaemolyticus VPCR-2010]
MNVKYRSNVALSVTETQVKQGICRRSEKQGSLNLNGVSELKNKMRG